ncbi:hypothetical protein H6758_03415 [Candidatus Nomurabacteria bacterium]|nr:hypothetical protein [Candidatus Nomurabacteria bacterium]
MNTTTLLDNLLNLDNKGRTNPYKEKIASCINNTLSKKEPLRLISFTCSTIQSQYLFTDTPWLYVNLDPAGNNLEADLPTLAQKVFKLQSLYPVELTILIGNTDPYYIYLQQFSAHTATSRPSIWQEFASRWEQYRINLMDWISQTHPALPISVVSWYTLEKKWEKRYGISFEDEFNQAYKNIDKLFLPSDFKWEKTQLTRQFGPGKYFPKLECPPEEVLDDWVRRKFAEYAVQGQWIYLFLKDSLLIQNEKPTDLRSKMYQPLIEKTFANCLPIVFFNEIDNIGYQ